MFLVVKKQIKHMLSYKINVYQTTNKLLLRVTQSNRFRQGCKNKKRLMYSPRTWRRLTLEFEFR